MKNTFNFPCPSRLFPIFLFFLTTRILPAQQTLCQQNNNFVPDIIINGSPVTLTSDLMTPGWNNQKVLINGTLEVNSNFQISNCVVKMADLATIKVDASVTLTSVFSNYFHCPLPAGNNFWTGIQVTGNLTFFFNHIEDADRAIEIKNASAQVVFVGNTVNRNYYGIYAENTAINAVVAANTFDCNAPLNGSSTAMGYAGISLSNCPSAILGRTDNVPAYRNTFRRQIMGINLDRSTAAIGLSTFNQNIRGIYAFQSFMTVRGVDESLTSNFTMNRSDIYTFSTRSDISRCYMDSCWNNNISSLANNNLEIVNIHHNDIHVTAEPGPDRPKMAINLDRTRMGSDNVFRNKITNNQITIHDFGTADRRGMYVRGGPGIHDFMKIEDNTIDALTGGSIEIGHASKFIDIDISGAENFNILGNHINSTNTFETGKNRWGIFLTNGADIPAAGNVADGNVIRGTTHDDGCCAFHAVDAGPWTICTNTTDETYRGFHFIGNCGRSQFSRNKIGDHNFDPFNLYVGGTGLFLQGHDADNVYIGDQACQGNYWQVTDYSLPNAFTAIIVGDGINQPSSNTIDNNNFWVDDINDPHQAPIDRNPIDDWFTEISCISVGCAEQLPPIWDENDERVRTLYPSPQTALSVEAWQSTRYVLSKLLRYPELAVGDALAFQTAYNQSSAAQFAAFDQFLTGISTLAAANQAPLAILESNTQGKLDQINTLDAGIINVMNIEPGLLANRTVLINDLAGLSAQRSALLAQNHAALQTKLAECIALNNALPGNQIYEQNQKFINAMAIKRTGGQELTESDKTALHTIAQQCSMTAGHTKSAAASLLPPEENIPYWQEDPNGQDCEIPEENRDHRQGIAQALLSPNPVSRSLHIELGRISNGEFAITDLAGRIVSTFSLPETQTGFDISVTEFENGMYFLSVRSASEGWMQVSRFVVQH